MSLSAGGQPPQQPQIVLKKTSESTAVWVDADGVVQTRSRPSGGAGFGAPIALSAAGAAAGAAQVGDVYDSFAIWERSDGANTRVQAAAVHYDHTTTGPIDLSAAGQDATHPQIADGYGDAVAVWERSDGANTVIQETRGGVYGPFGAPVDVSAPGQDALDPQLANMDGDVFVAWRRFDGTSWIVQAAMQPRAGAVGEPVDLSAAGADAMSPRIAVNDYYGNAIVVWRRFDGSHWIVQAAVRPESGAYSAPVDVSSAGQDAFDPDVVVDGSGNATIVWRAVTGAGNVVQAVTKPLNGDFSTPADLSAAAPNASEPRATASVTGGVVVVWRRFDGTSNVVQAARRSSDDTGFSAPVDVSEPGEEAGDPRVSSGTIDDAIAIWRRDDGVIRARALDAAGPSFLFDGFYHLGPDRAVAGQPVQFGRPIASDAWSTVGDTTWTFGDGTSAITTGPTVRHTYAGTGVYRVTATVVDAVGNGSRVSDDMAVAPAPVAPPPPPRPAAPPTLSRLRLSRTTFRAAAKGAATTSAAPTRTGTRVSYALDKAASVLLAVERAVPGRRVGGACVRSSKSNRAHRRCARYASVAGGVTRSRGAGSDHFTLTGRLAGHRLTPGRYRLVAFAFAAHRDGARARRSFRIVR